MGRFFNFMTILFLILSVVVVGLGVSSMLRPAPPAVIEDDLPTPLVLPTLTPSFTPTSTLPPTSTPIPTETPIPSATPTIPPTVPTATPTETVTNTPVPPTLPPSATPVPSQTITETPTITLTPTDTPTITPTFTPTGPTVVPTLPPSPFPFTLRNNQVAFTNNFANTAGCQWQGLGGAVFDLTGQPFPGLRVHVYGPNTDVYTASGTNSLYGQGSGWELAVSNAINANTYYVELQSQEGTVISPVVQITFPGSCQGNLAVINFEQTRPLN